MAITGRVYTVEGAQRALSKLPKELQKEVRKASQDIASDIVRGARSAAGAQGGLAAHVSRSIRARRDRYPVIEMGRGTLRPGVRMTDVIWGAEFGGGSRPSTSQFRPHLGQRGYFLYPTVRDQSDDALKRWLDAVQKSLDAI